MAGYTPVGSSRRMDSTRLSPSTNARQSTADSRRRLVILLLTDT